MNINRGQNLQEIIFFKIENIYKLFFNIIVAILLIIIIFFIPVSLFLHIITIESFSFPLDFFLFLITSLFVIFILAFGYLRKQILRRKMWKFYQEIIPNFKSQIDEKAQKCLISFMGILRILSWWGSVIAFFVILWGLTDLFIITFNQDYFNVNETFLIFISIMKIIIAFLMFLSIYFTMIAPLKRLTFWKKMFNGINLIKE
jgi:hypothetical protein